MFINLLIKKNNNEFEESFRFILPGYMTQMEIILLSLILLEKFLESGMLILINFVLNTMKVLQQVQMKSFFVHLFILNTVWFIICLMILCKIILLQKLPHLQI